MPFPDVTPRPAPDERRAHAHCFSGLQVVIQAVTYVDNFASFAWGRAEKRMEKRRVRFTRLPVVRCGDHVSGQTEAPQDPASARSLVTGYPYPHAHCPQRFQSRPYVRVQIVLPERLGLSGSCAPGTLGV